MNKNTITYVIALQPLTTICWNYAASWSSLFFLVPFCSSYSLRSHAVYYWIFKAQPIYITQLSTMWNWNVSDAWWFCGCFQRWKAAHASLELFYEETKVSTDDYHINILFLFLLPLNNTSLLAGSCRIHNSNFCIICMIIVDFLCFYCGRVLADGHVPWACEAFSKLYGKELISSRALFWYSFCSDLQLIFL